MQYIGKTHQKRLVNRKVKKQKKIWRQGPNLLEDRERVSPTPHLTPVV